MTQPFPHIYAEEPVLPAPALSVSLAYSALHTAYGHPSDKVLLNSINLLSAKIKISFVKW